MWHPALFRLPRRSARMVAEEVDAEIRFHMEARAEQLVRRGLSPEQAREEARRRFGNVDVTRRALRASVNRREGRMRRRERLEQFLFDLRHALRQLRREPGFALVAMLTLAVGVAAATVMFGVVDQLLLRPPPYIAAPERVGRVHLAHRGRDGEFGYLGSVSYHRYAQLQDGARGLAQLAAFSAGTGWVGEGGDAEQAHVGRATASLFPVLGVRPAVGRFFTSAEDSPPDGRHVAVLGHELWQRRFGGDSAVLGRSVRVGAARYTVVGVAPPGFRGVEMHPVDVWLPATTMRTEVPFFLGPDWTGTHSFSWLEVVARLEPGVSRERASAALTLALGRSLEAELEGRRTLEELQPAATIGSVLADRGPEPSASARVSLWLAAVAALVVLIACANVANLLLARSLRRRRELAVRVALGVSRARLMGQLLLESLLIAGAAGVMALLVVQWGGALVRTMLLSDVPWTGALGDGRVLLFAFGAVVTTTLLCGLAPAVMASRPNVAAVLRTGERGGGARRGGLRTVLLITQAALSVVLLVGAGLFVRSLHNVRTRDLGFTYDRQLLASVDFRGSEPDTGAPTAALRQQLLERLRAVPGVETATTTMSVPFRRNMTVGLFDASGDSLANAWMVYHNGVGTDYFATTGVRILRGRALARSDVQGAAPVVVVSESMARRYWPAADALGQCVRLGVDTMPCATIVGIAANVAQEDFHPDSTMQLWWPGEQRLGWMDQSMTWIARVRGEPAALAVEVQRSLQDELTGNAVVRVQPLGATLEPSVRSWRLGATMFVLFGALALVIAAVGLYGVIAYQVGQRRHEVGVRLALGARAGQVMRAILGEGVRLTAVGVAVGAAISLAAGRWVAPLLFEVSPADPLTYGAVVAVLLAVAVLASLLPARRAARVDPMEALRAD